MSASTYITYTGAGVQTDFTVTFPYISQSHVYLSVNGVISTAYTWLNATTLRMTSAPTGTVKVYRATPQSPLVNFTDGSTLVATDLNIEGKQGIYIAQEASDIANDASTIATASTAIVTNAATAALASQNSATASASTASSQAGVATAQATASSLSASNASASASAAGGSATTATTQASNASGSATSASGSATTATTQAGTATTQAGIATTQATNASASATSASGSATTATTQAGIATTQASNASASFASMDVRFLGSKASNPTLDNSGGVLVAGALYYNTVSLETRVYSGSAWAVAYIPSSGYVTLTGAETLSNKTLVTPLLGTPTSGNLANCTFPTLNQNTSGSSGSTTGNASTVTTVTQVNIAGAVAPSTSGNVLTSNGTAWTSATPVGYAGFSTVLFASSGTWTIPTGITRARVTVFGGGSGGFTSATAAAGGFGGFAQAYITGLSGSVTITVGLGSNEATAGSSTAGGTTSFGSYISATGGGTASSGSAGASGTGTVTTGIALRTGSISATNSGLFLLGGSAGSITTSSTVAIVWSPSSTFIAGKCGSSIVGGGGSVGGLVIIEY